VLGVFGGSLGARAINEALAGLLPDLLKRYYVLHVCGQDRFREAQAHAEALPHDLRAQYRLHAYLEEDAMADAMAASDLALARSGASILGELPATGTPAILVPLPIPGVHQRENAEYLADNGAAVVLQNDRLQSDLGDVLEVLLRDGERLEGMAEACRALFRPEAADRIADVVMEAAR
jgi:UDP-N-acetylglucosamine--N-acetylmuramyl-(pentapeptide) pyrophosphoryl-undecaprenol N-acetylglucosamine transferase